MQSRILKLTILLFAVVAGPVLCAPGCAGDPEQSNDYATEDPQNAVVIDEAGDGQSFDVIEGQQVIVRLPGNITTGYEWAVASTDRTFGYPVEEDYIPDEPQQAGSGGTFELVWNTESVLPMVGSHTVVLEYRRPWEEGEPADSFTFTVNVKPAGEDSTDALVIDGTGDGMTFDVEEGRDVVVLLEGNPTTGYEWVVASTDRTFGYPASEDYHPSEEQLAGSGGIFEFVWKTDGALPMTGAHTVVLHYQRSWEDGDPADTFTFTVNILAEQAQQ